MNGYDLSRSWFDYCFENPEIITPNHTAIFFFAIEHCNRLGWKAKFGFPTQMAMDAIGIKKHQTYIKYFNDICQWGFFILVQKSTNQYSANIISLSQGIPISGKALDKAITKHTAKQTQSNGQSNSSIDKPLTLEPLTLEQRKLAFANSLVPFNKIYQRDMLMAFYEYWTEMTRNEKKMAFELKKTWETKKRLNTWFVRSKSNKPQESKTNQQSTSRKTLTDDELRKL